MRNWIILSGLAVCLLAILALNAIPKASEEVVEISANIVASEKLHPSSYAKEFFFEGIEQPDYVDRISEPSSGGIVSHHLLARDEIAKFFAEFRSQSVNTVVLVAPNHFTIGEASVITSKTGFTTPFGDIMINHELLDQLIEKKVVAVDEEPFSHEHSIGALTPYIAYNLPDAKIVPLILRKNTSRKQLDDLLEEIKPLLPEDTVVVASVDFSHHLNRIATNFHDISSVSAIKDFDYDRIFDTEIDSPASIYFLLRYLESLGAKRMHYTNLNSTDFTGNLATEDATSYVFAHFSSGQPDGAPTSATSLHFGDMMFDRGIEDLLVSGEDVFEEIKGRQGNFLKGVDVTMGNFEGVISASKECRSDKEVILKFDSSVAELLKEYNFSGVNLANNHTGDCYESGIKQTQETLQENGLFYLGSELGDGYEVVEVGSESIAIVGINEVTRQQDNVSDTLALIGELSSKHDSVVVHVHWGVEFRKKPTVEQRDFAYQLVDAGAEAVIGHHPHVVQDVEIYNGKIIFYSLGNFIFDQVLPGATEGFAVGLVHQEGVTGGSIFPYKINDLKPILMSYEEMSEYCASVLSDIERLDECSFLLE